MYWCIVNRYVLQQPSNTCVMIFTLLSYHRVSRALPRSSSPTSSTRTTCLMTLPLTSSNANVHASSPTLASSSAFQWLLLCHVSSDLAISDVCRNGNVSGGRPQAIVHSCGVHKRRPASAQRSASPLMSDRLGHAPCILIPLMDLHIPLLHLSSTLCTSHHTIYI